MTCNMFNEYLDRMMDNELSEEQLRALEDHAKECAECAEALAATKMMMETLSDMPEEIDVPLQAQAAWRKAVRTEMAAKSNVRRKSFMRSFIAVAAALIVLVGVGFVGRRNAKPVMETGMNVQSDAIVETAVIMADGMDEAAEVAMTEEAAPMIELEMKVEKLDDAGKYIADLASEYEGNAEVQMSEENGVACANLFVNIPAENVADFLQAAKSYDLSGAELTAPTEATGEIALLIVLTEA